MTRQKYLQLVKKSEIFKSFSADAQKDFLEADGELLAIYSQILKLADADMLEAKKAFIVGAGKLMDDYKKKNLQTERVVAKQIEKDWAAQESRQMEQLIDQLNQ